MSYDPNEHMMKLKGKDYLPVAARLVWFRLDHSLELGIRTTVVEHDPDTGRALLRAEIFDAASTVAAVLATGHKTETRKDFPDYLEKAETGAIGRALAVLGYGTQFAPELDEEDRIVDSPQPPPRPRRVGEADIMRAGEPPEFIEMVRSVNDRVYQRYAEVCELAGSLDVDYETVVLPVAKQRLIDLGKELSEAIGLAKAKAPVK